MSSHPLQHEQCAGHMASCSLACTEYNREVDINFARLAIIRLPRYWAHALGPTSISLLVWKEPTCMKETKHITSSRPRSLASPKPPPQRPVHILQHSAHITGCVELLLGCVMLWRGGVKNMIPGAERTTPLG